MGISLPCTSIGISEYLTKRRNGFLRREHISRPFRRLAALAQLIAAILALSATSFADVRGPYFLGGGGGTTIALLGFFLSLSIAVAGIWFFWYRRRGGSRPKSWIIASVIAIGMFLLIGVVTTVLTLL